MENNLATDGGGWSPTTRIDFRMLRLQRVKSPALYDWVVRAAKSEGVNPTQWVWNLATAEKARREKR